MCEIENAQYNFLQLYNRGRTRIVAFQKAWAAAVQRNPLYRVEHPVPTVQQRHAVRDRVDQFISDHIDININNLLIAPMTEENYLVMIVQLKNLINEVLGNCFRPDGFRIAHAQKVLGVYMKHLWCMEQIQTPPQCPIDRKILVTISQYPQYRRFRYLAWTQINDLNEHCEIIAAIQAIAPAQQIAHWELLNFQG